MRLLSISEFVRPPCRPPPSSSGLVRGPFSIHTIEGQLLETEGKPLPPPPRTGDARGREMTVSSFPQRPGPLSECPLGDRSLPTPLSPGTQRDTQPSERAQAAVSAPHLGSPGHTWLRMPLLRGSPRHIPWDSQPPEEASPQPPQPALSPGMQTCLQPPTQGKGGAE